MKRFGLESPAMVIREVMSMPSWGVLKKTIPYIARMRFCSSSFSDLDNDIKAYRTH